MKKSIEYVTYIKDDLTILVEPSGLFVYESSVYLYHKDYFALCNQKYFSNPREINGVVESFWKTPHIQICSELFAAPEQWLIDNGFTRYTKPKKDEKVTNNVKVKGNAKQKTKSD
jgi:hypothetical protein